MDVKHHRISFFFSQVVHEREKAEVLMKILGRGRVVPVIIKCVRNGEVFTEFGQV